MTGSSVLLPLSQLLMVFVWLSSAACLLLCFKALIAMLHRDGVYHESLWLTRPLASEIWLMNRHYP